MLGLVGFGAYVQLSPDTPEVEAPGRVDPFVAADLSNSSLGLASALATTTGQQLEAAGLFSMNGKVYKQGFRGNQYVKPSAVAAAKSTQRVLATTGRVATRVGAGVGFGLAAIDVYRGGASNQSLAKGAVGAIGTGSAFVPVVGPFLSLGISITNAAGGFDGLYNRFGATPRF